MARFVLLLFVCCLLSGCSSARWQQYETSRANPLNWILPPVGESFYSEQAQDIDRRLQREPNVQ